MFKLSFSKARQSRPRDCIKAKRRRNLIEQLENRRLLAAGVAEFGSEATFSAAIRISESSTEAVPVDLRVSEDPISNLDQFWVSLESEPTADVTVTFVSTSTGDLLLADGIFDQTLEPSQPLTFTPANWDIPQDVIIRGESDLDVEGTDIIDVNWSVTSNDNDYGALSGSLSAKVYDADTDGDVLVINEFVNGHEGTDTNEFVELKNLTDPLLGPTFATFHLLQIDGNGADQGLVDSITTVSPGIGVGAYETFNFNDQVEDGSMTWLLVEGLDPDVSVGFDLDADNDGMLDLPKPWTLVNGQPADAVGVFDGDDGDAVYTDVVLEPNFDSGLPGGGTTVAGASRIPDGFIDAGVGGLRGATSADGRFGWNFGDAGSINGTWDNLTVPVGAPGNLPDVNAFGSGINSVLTQTVPSAFITSTGNIYSFAAATDFDVVVDTSSLNSSANFTRIVAQWNTLGNQLDYANIRIGNTAPVYTERLNEFALGGMGGAGIDFLAVWDLPEAPQPSYTIEFNAAGSSMSLAQFQVDAFASNVAFEEATPFNQFTRNNPFDLPGPATDIIPGLANSTNDSVNEVQQGLVILESDSGTAVTEGDAASVDSYQILLGADPTDPVTVSIQADGQQEIAVDTDDDGDFSDETFGASGSILFGTTSGLKPKTVFVRAVDDSDIEDLTHPGSITHTAVSDDPDAATFPKLLTNEYGTAGNVVSVSVADDDGDTTSPQVTGVYATGSTWTPGGVDALDGDGESAGNGLGIAITTQQVIPNSGVDTFHIQLSEEVFGLDASAVQVLGINQPDYSSLIDSVSFDSSSFLATITLTSPIVNDSIRIAINDTVADAAGNALDGDSDSSPGGIFDLTLGILAGDANGDGFVLVNDITPLLNALNQSFPLPGYNASVDFVPDGLILVDDISFLVGQLNESLPSGTPADASFTPPSSIVGAGSNSTALASIDAVFSELEEDDRFQLDEESRLF
ncbi:MAG: hypothetical protein AAF664_14740 [Planctomycetota bacterium]